LEILLWEQWATLLRIVSVLGQAFLEVLKPFLNMPASTTAASNIFQRLHLQPRSIPFRIHFVN